MSRPVKAAEDTLRGSRGVGRGAWVLRFSRRVYGEGVGGSTVLGTFQLQRDLHWSGKLSHAAAACRQSKWPAVP